MEMGVDIGGLSSIAMNNTPPSPANYLQRAGRAGRRRESRAFSLTLCKSSPHGEWVFRQPTWAFNSPMHVSEVALTSDRILQRHINSLALTRFFETQVGQGELPRLEASAFFVGTDEAPSVAERFALWLTVGAADDSWLETGMQSLLRRTSREGASVHALLATVAEAIREVSRAWLAEIDPLERELASLGEMRDEDVVRRAIEIQLKRAREEYLLRELALRNFLPGHGFPTQVVPLVTTTMEDLQRRQRAREDGERDDSLTRSRGYPTRDLAQAIREYAPGSTVVLDGRVLQSDGVTLNWKIPASDAGVREIQALRWAWRCARCGAADRSMQRPEHCPVPECGARLKHVQRYLEPSGFAVAINYEASNDLSQNTYLPVESPWVSAGRGTWQSFARPELGRVRSTDHGHVFSYSRGAGGSGYAICLRCGRSASMRGDELPDEMLAHRPLRGGADRREDGACRGNDSSWSIVTGVSLGVMRETDVVEVQLNPLQPLDAAAQRQAAASIAVALRQALTQRIGVEEREVGWSAASDNSSESGTSGLSILLFDAATGGAGFVGQGVRHLPELLRAARRILTCPRNCDAACHACLVTYDTSHHVQDLNRHHALRVLSEEFVGSLDLPHELRVFGDDTRFEYDAIAFALVREGRWAQRIRLHLDGAAAAWDLDEWPLHRQLARWMGDGIGVDLVCGKSTLAALPDVQRNRLASMVEARQVRVVERTAASSDPCLIAELGGAAQSVQFAIIGDALAPNAEWGHGAGSARIVSHRRHEPLADANAGEVVRTAQSLRVRPAGAVAATTINSEIDGSLSGFGPRFWAAVLASAPDMRERFEANAPIDRVTYQDRYVKSPLSMRLVVELFRGLKQLLPGAVPGTRISVVTREPDLRHAPREEPRFFAHDWPPTLRRADVFTAALAISGLTGQWQERGWRDAAHARELTVRWADGAEWTVRLDEGLGFVEGGRRLPFEFRRSAQEQAVALMRADFPVIARNPTHFYTFPVVRR
jgi:hypothetical protein